MAEQCYRDASKKSSIRMKVIEESLEGAGLPRLIDPASVIGEEIELVHGTVVMAG